MLATSAVALRREYAVWRVGSAETTAAIDQSIRPGDDVFGAPASVPPRAALVMALVQTRAASGERSAERRDVRLARAGTLLGIAEAGRPGWGQAAVARSYWFLIRDEGASAAAMEAFARSYVEPFLAESALWRIGFGAFAWPRLDARLRTHVIDEALWYAATSKLHAAEVRRLLGRGAAHDAFRAALPAYIAAARGANR